MPRKPRPEPFTQGSLRDIYKYFFGALIRYKPGNVSIREWMDHLFDHPNRDISRYVVTKQVRIPGLFYAAALRKVQGIGYRQLTIGTVLWVRQDARAPDSIDVEIEGGATYALNASEWNYLQLHAEESERKRAKHS